MKNILSRSWIRAVIICIFSMICGIALCYIAVSWNASGHTFDNVDDVPAHEYGLLLATSPITPQGAHNFYFDNRIKSAVDLYEAGKIKRIIASGGDYRFDENGKPTKYGCDEPRAIRDSLVARGLPVDAIVLDYDGTRTLNSIVKAKQVYGLDSVVLISQKYHNERAIWQADHYGLKAVGYNAAPSHIRRNRIKNTAREFFARVKLMLDMWFGKTPKFNVQAVEVAPGIIEDWYSYPDSLNDRSVKTFRSDSDHGHGFYKVFGELNGIRFYYNSTHGFFLWLPEGIGFNQVGENMMGAHENEFYNADSTLVINAGGMFYDAVLVDEPNYPDSLRQRHLDYLSDIGKVTYLQDSPETIVCEVKIDHTKSDFPPQDLLLSKWILKKDVNNRECQMCLNIFLKDSLSYRLPEARSIIKKFPDMP